MKKRILSLVLCLVMLMSYAVPAANAAGNTNDVYYDNDIIVGENVDMSNVVIDGNNMGTVPAPSQVATESTEATTSPVLAETEPEPVCKCGECASVSDHADGCVVKQYYVNLCAGTAEELYAKWEEFSADEQEFILAYLGWNYPETLKGLEALQAANAAPTGEASVAIDGATVNAEGIPEGGSMTVEDVETDEGAVDNLISDLDAESATELFSWDISVQDAVGAEWQPDGSVKLELDLPDVKLNKHSKIYIIHTADNGDVSYIPAEITEDGKVAFETYGFSTFAGFTVDFSYEGVEFSIDGMTSILLSEVFDKLEMALDVADVLDVTFTDETLVALEKLEGDWELKSLKAFDTTEKLTVFMNNGKVYEITVTDLEVVAGNQTWDIWNGYHGAGVNHAFYSAGFPNTNTSLGGSYKYIFNSDAYHNWNYYQSGPDTVYFDDSNQVTTITIKPGTGDGQVINNGQLIVDMFEQFYINNGAKVTIQLDSGSGFNSEGITEVVLKDLDSSAFFYVLSGSLTIKGRSDVPIVISANSGTNYPSIYMINNASALTLENVKFRNATKGAIGLCADSMSSVSLTNCTFESTVTNSTYGGGAIFLSDVYQKTYTSTPYTISSEKHGNEYANVAAMTITNCTFDTNKTTVAANKLGYGGAIGLFGKVDSLTISGTTFTDCVAYCGGGAISIGGTAGTVSITGCTFTGCKAQNYYGGAIHTWTRRVKFPTESGSTVGQYTRVNHLHITNTKFEDGYAGQNGGAIGIQGQLHTLEVDGTTQFINNEAKISGGAICLGSIAVDSYDTTPTGCTSKILFTAGYSDGKTNATVQPYINGDTVHKYTTIASVKITGQLSDSFDSHEPGATPTFWTVEGGTTQHQAGFLAIAQFARVDSIDLQRLAIKGSETLNEGSCVYLHASDVLEFKMEKCWIQDCDFTKGDDGVYLTDKYVGGTIRTIGATGVVMTIDNCYFYNNASMGNGGAIYYNAATDTRNDINGNPLFPDGISATIQNCNFFQNKALRDGGAIYCEANVLVKNCLIHENTARRGGGIAQQVYNNAGRPIQEGEFTTLKLDSNTKIYKNRAEEYTGGLIETHPDHENNLADGGHGGGISIICNNTGALPLDTTMAYPVTFVLGGAQVYENTAHNNGGGIYYKTLSYAADAPEQKQVDQFVKDITIDNGEIYENEAGVKGNGGHGGGIYMESNQMNDDATGSTTLKITGGNIYKNTATGGNGGGIYLLGRKALCTITGGTVGGDTTDDANKATKVNGAGGCGGGIAIAGGAHIDMVAATTGGTGGTVAYNDAAFQGGGIWLENRAETDEVVNSISISNGNVKYNKVSASNATSANGGGIFIGSYDTATLTGGEIMHNTTPGWGGGIFTDLNVTLTISGDAKVNNNSASAGGGIGCQQGDIVTITGGQISHNTATANGGGILANSKCNITVNGGQISNNTATSNGGGIISTSSTITLGGGSVSNNSATSGGGILCQSGSTVTINTGTMSGNTATSSGGAIYCDASAVTLNGGTVSGNSAQNGGGIRAKGGSTITIAQPEGSTVGGQLLNNTASQNGGGINMTDSGTSVTITGGTVKGNTASINGGGFSINSGCTATVEGGTITQNTAASGGGIYIIGSQTTYNTTLNVVGGEISSNTANGTGQYNGQGGGIFADRLVEVNVTNKEGSTEVGKITKNTASKGGGVYVCAGAHLTVINGHITYNKATGTCSNKTTNLQNHGLHGVGGGVYVADGTATNPSKFTLKGGENGANIAIYGNLADFAADDVFSNANNTDLQLPTVGSMNLDGYPLPAVAWVEDYPVNDIEYEIGLNHGAAQEISNGKNVFRYRKSDAQFRVLVPENNVTTATFTPNVDNEYVCLTLGMPSALPDTVVIDYGLPVLIDVINNDIGINGESAGDPATLEAIGMLRPAVADNQVDYTESAIDSTWDRSTTGCSYGKTVMSDGKVKYTPKNMQMKTQDSFSYAAKFIYTDDNNVATTYYFYSSVTVIPATTIYYEDSLGSGFVTFRTYNISVDADGKVTETINAQAGGQWTDAGTKVTNIQQEDRPGYMQDIADVYGNDAAYKSMTTYSMGSAKKVTVSATKSATANFTFWGTGFDVISLTSNTSGTIMITVTRKDVTPNVTEYYMVDTYYGYTYSNGKWEVSSSNTNNALYQIPVMKVNDMPYGKYDVEIYAAYDKFFDHKNANSYDLYIDAIRIYDPANDGKDNQVITDAYLADREGWPAYQEVRDMLLTADSFNAPGYAYAYKAVFIDGFSGKTNGRGEGTASVADYMNYGPNNELYLTYHQCVAFKFNAASVNELLATKYPNAGIKIATVQIAVKSANSRGAEFEIYSMANNYRNLNGTVNSATDRYFDITNVVTNSNGEFVDSGIVIHNKNDDDILSITNLKVTFTGDVGSGKTEWLWDEAITVDEQTVNQALAYMDAQIEAAPSISLKYPTLSFESEIKYNIFCDIDADADVTEMGLITFNSELTDGTIDNAEEVIPGETKMNDLHMVSSNGIAAKNLGDDLYFKVYAKLADGSYVYSDIASYNAVKYANSILSNENSSAKSKALVTAMLNYGAAAQTYFGYNTDSLMNANLTAEKASISDYSADMLSAVVSVDSAKAVNFVDNGGFDKKYPTVSFEGAFSINYNFVPANAVDGEMTLYYWDLETYNSADVLSVENAIGSKTVTLGDNGEYSASYDGIAAKEIDETVFVAAVYESNGETYCSGVLAYSLGAYCVDRIANGSADMQAFAAATAVYGYYAKAYFANV